MKTSENKVSFNSAAVLTVFGAAQMSDAGRRAIAAWLRRQAHYLVKEGESYSPRHIARYLRESRRSAGSDSSPGA